ncbi:MAG: hypothetical protein MJ181_04825 [Treponema sp.]|nr:hypothetical protein [Treponema sp.]
MNKIKFLFVLFSISISSQLFAQQYKAFNIDGSIVYRWCTWKTTTFEKKGLKQIEKVVNEQGQTVSLREQEFYPSGQLKKDEFTEYLYTFFSGIKYPLGSTKNITYNEYYEDGSLRAEKKSGIFDESGYKENYAYYYDKNHFVERFENNNSSRDYEYLYDAENRLVCWKNKFSLDSSPKSEEEYFYEYTKKGQLKSVFYIKDKGERELLYEYFYDSNNLLIKEHDYKLKTGNVYKYTEDEKGRLIKLESNSLRYIDKEFIEVSDLDSYRKWISMDFFYDKNGNLMEITTSDPRNTVWPNDKYLKLTVGGKTFFDASPEFNDVISHYKLEKYAEVYSYDCIPFKNSLPAIGKYETDKDGRLISVPEKTRIIYDSEGKIIELINYKNRYSYYYPVSNSDKIRSPYHYFYNQRKAEKNEFLLSENGIVYECKKDDSGRLIQKGKMKYKDAGHLTEYIYTPSGKLEKEIRKSMTSDDNRNFKIKSVMTYNNKELPSKVFDSDGNITQMYVYKYNEDGSIKTKTLYTFEVPTSF